MEQGEAAAKAREGYDQMAQVYADHVAFELTVPSLVRSALETFAHQVDQLGSGAVADVGCGPGHVTAFLAGLGLDIVGIDIAAELLSIARTAHPEVRFELGQLASLPIEAGALQALVSKHSLIHTPPELVAPVLAEFQRVLAPGGLLYLSFFGAADPSSHGLAFDHAVTTAYQLDVEAMAKLLRDAGFIEDLRIVQQPGEHERQLPHGTLFARRR